MLIDTEKPFWARCLYHHCDLEAAGHSMGLGMECFPLVSFEEARKKAFFDLSEMACPMCVQGTLTDEAFDAEFEKCQDSWEFYQSDEIELR